MDKILQQVIELRTDISIGLDNETSSVVDRLVQIQNDLEQLKLCSVSFELPSDDIFDVLEVDLQNPLEEFYYYERPAYLEDDQKQFRKRLQKALNYLKGN